MQDLAMSPLIFAVFMRRYAFTFFSTSSLKLSTTKEYHRMS